MKKFFIPTKGPTEVILTTWNKVLNKILWLVTLFLFGLVIYMIHPFFSTDPSYAEWEPNKWFFEVLCVFFVSLWESIVYQSWIDWSYDLDKDS